MKKDINTIEPIDCEQFVAECKQLAEKEEKLFEEKRIKEHNDKVIEILEYYRKIFPNIKHLASKTDKLSDYEHFDVCGYKLRISLSRWKVGEPLEYEAGKLYYLFRRHNIRVYSKESFGRMVEIVERLKKEKAKREYETASYIQKLKEYETTIYIQKPRPWYKKIFDFFI